MPSSGMRSRRRRLLVLEGLRAHGRHRHGTPAGVQEQVTVTRQGDGQGTEQMTLFHEKGMFKRAFCLFLLFLKIYLITIQYYSGFAIC